MRDNSNIVKGLQIFAVSALWMCVAGLNAMAATNTLSAVEIKNSENGYQIILKADKSAEVRKTVESKDDVTLDVKGIAPVESVGTIYNNVPEVDSIIIQPDADNTKVIVHGKNIASASILFAPIEVQAVPQSEGETVTSTGANELELSQPIQSYTPVFNNSQSLEDEAPGGMFETAASLSLQKAHQVKPYIGKLLRYLMHLDKKYLAFGSVFFLIILFGFKSIKSDSNNEIKVGLTQSLKEQEIGMRDELSLSNDLQTLRSQKSFADKNVPSINYGIKAYQNSQRNPYTSQISGLPMKNIAKPQPRQTPVQSARPISNRPKADQNQAQLQAKLNQVKAQSQIKKPVSAPASLNNVKPSMAPSAGAKGIDSMKFLESMTKIYERSGRADLANELKSNMQKVQLAR